MAEAPASQSPPDPNAEVLAAVNRIRDLAKWLLLALGAIGGTLLAGSQVADIGGADDQYLLYAGAAIVVSLIGVGIAIAFTVKVMTPTDVSWQQVVKAKKPALAKMIKKEPALLYGCKSIAAFEAKRQEAIEAAAAASAASAAKPLSTELRQARTKAQEDCDSLNKKAERLTVLAMYAETQRKLNRAFVAMLLGGAVTVLGIVGFAWATNQSEDPTPTAAVSAVPKRPSAVTVDLSPHGIDVLTKRVGDACSVKPLRAIALGGEPDALDLVSTPTADCATTRFTLTENMGTVVGDETVVLPGAGAAP